MARPGKSPDKLTQKVGIRVTSHQLRKLDALYEQYGLSRSAALRQLAETGEITIVTIPEPTSRTRQKKEKGMARRRFAALGGRVQSTPSFSMFFQPLSPARKTTSPSTLVSFMALRQEWYTPPVWKPVKMPWSRSAMVAATASS